MFRQYLLSAAICFSLTNVLFAEKDNVTAYTGATIMTATGEVYSPGTLIIRDKKIATVGPVDEVKIPDEAEVVELEGKYLIPGLVDTHSHLGVYSKPGVRSNSDGNESTGPIQSIVRALDSINPYDPGIKMALAGGITTANIMPGSANPIGGQTLYVKLRGYTPEQMWLGPSDVVGGLKMANGENPKRSYGSRNQAPGTRMKIAAMQRAEFIKAQAYQRKWESYRQKRATGQDVDPPEVDLSLEPLVEVLEKRRTVHFHTHRADDILTVLRLKKEFGFDLVIQHGTEGYKVAKEIAAAGVPVSMTVIDSPGGKAEVVDLIESCGARLAAAGVKVVINTDDPVTESRLFLRTAAVAHRGGMTEQDTLKAITLHAAEALHVADRLDSLEQGKDADFVVLSGRPFSTYTRVLETYIDGRKEFDAADPAQIRYQTGGFALPKERRPKPIDLDLTFEALPEAQAIQAESSFDESATEFYIHAATLYPISQSPIKDGLVHVKDGKILYAGPRKKRKLKKIPIIEAVAVSPGLIDAYSVVPLSGEYNIPADQDADEESGPNQADVRVLDSFNPSEPLMNFLLQNGVTVIHACPGEANVIAGLTGVFKTFGNSADKMAIRFPQAMFFNLGDRPKQAYSGSPGTRMGTASILRKSLGEAVTYARKQAKATENGEEADRNLQHEHLAKVLNGGLPSIFRADRSDDILTASRISDEFNLNAIIAMGTEAYLVKDQIKDKKLPVIVNPPMQRVGGLETYHSSLANAAYLDQAEIPIAICSGFEGYVPKTRVIRHEAAMAATYGLGHERALYAITLGAAKILKIDQDYGSLEKGKIADLVLYNGDPFEHRTQVQKVFMGGKLVFDQSNVPEIPITDLRLFSLPEVPCCNWW